MPSRSPWSSSRAVPTNRVEFWCTYTACGICKLAQREGMQEYLPCLCRTDFLSYGLVGARLERTKTLGAGEDCCDFHVVREV